MKDCLKDLIVKVKDGDKEAFDRLFHIFHPKIYHFCRHYHLCREEAEEIVQEVFLKIWLNRVNIDISYSIQSFIYTIAKNLILNTFKRKIYQKAAYEYHMSQRDHYYLEKDIICSDLNRIIDHAINDMPLKRREIFNLSRKKGLSNKEIANTLEISLKTVESQMRLSLQYLRQVLNHYTELILLILWIESQFI